MTDRIWHKGPPPFPGWWNASAYRDEEMWRWWDGKAWSYGALSSDSSRDAKKKSGYKYLGGFEIEWTDYYPKDARVPRIDPRKFANEEARRLATPVIDALCESIQLHKSLQSKE